MQPIAKAPFSIRETRRLFLFLFFFSLIAITIPVSIHRASTGSSDFDVYYFAARTVLNGASPYTMEGHATLSSKSPFVYPPFFAIWMGSLAVLPVQAAAAVWNVGNLFFLAGCFFLMRSWLWKEESRIHLSNFARTIWSVAAIALVLAVIFDNIAMAQVNILVFFFILLACARYQNARQLEGGWWLGLAAAIKLIPIIFFLYFLIKRKFRFLLGGIFALAFCFLIFPLASIGHERTLTEHRTWFHETIQDHLNPKTLGFYASQLNPSHQNIQAVAFRVLLDWEFRERTGGPHGREFKFRAPIRLSEPEAGRAAKGFAFFLLLLVCVALWRSGPPAKEKERFRDAAALLFTAMVLLSSKARSHFFVFLFVPWAILIQTIAAHPLREVRRRAKLTFLASVFFYLLQVSKYLKFLGAGCASVLVLFGYFLYRVFKPPLD